jgi:hypothetical protein
MSATNDSKPKRNMAILAAGVSTQPQPGDSSVPVVTTEVLKGPILVEFDGKVLRKVLGKGVWER